jgi:alpha-tubulin suppressor-like RCC1 family protein
MRATFIGFALMGLAIVEPLAQTTTPKVSAGGLNSVALKNDGTLRAWGFDGGGQLGRGTSLGSSTALKVTGLPKIVTLSVGQSHVLAIAADGSLWAWGSDFAGELGNGSTGTSSAVPAQVNGITNVIAVSAGNFFSIAIKSDGTVWAWGHNDAGQLGDGTLITKTAPTQIPGFTGAIAVAAGPDHTVVLRNDGTVWAWGNNTHGQLGDGTTTSRSSPAQVPGLSGIVGIAAGQGFQSSCCFGGLGHSLALGSDGRVWAWGYNDRGQLGDGTTIARLAPVPVVGLSGVVSIAAGGDSTNFSLALKSDGTVWGWGDNGNGDLGTDVQSVLLAIQIAGLTNVTAIAAGGGHTLARRSDGTVLALGKNQSGQLGNGITGDTSYPVTVTGLSTVSIVAVGHNTSMALLSDGSVWAWGENSTGQLGNNQILNSTIPVSVLGLTGVTDISAAFNFALALRADGSVWRWGSGIGGASASSVPVSISGLTEVIAISAGYEHAVALRSDGTVWTWGENNKGQLGTGNNYPSQTPVQVLSGAVAIAAGYEHSVALMADGTIRAWGDNTYGELGDGTQVTRNSPVPVFGLSGVTKIFAHNGSHTGALKSDGSLWTWGSNGSGELGDGTTITRNSPVQVIGLSNVVQCSLGGRPDIGVVGPHSVCVRTDGSVWAWGNNVVGQLGDGTLTTRTTPVPIADFSGAIAASAGLVHTTVLKANGTVWSVGLNVFGALGDGTYGIRIVPQVTINETGSDFLDLVPGTAKNIPAGKIPPFFVVASGGITDTSASVSTMTKFNASDVGKSGAVFVTAMVPPGSLVPAQSPMSGIGASAVSGTSSALTAANSFVLVQLTASGWQPVVNGQLIAYASGVLGDQLAAQAILNNTDTTNLKGAEFCLGYGTSAEQMIAGGTMRTVATIPDPNATSASTVSCIVGIPLSYTLLVPAGWNLLGNSLNQTFSVASLFGDPNVVTTVWKWDAVNAAWQFYAPSMDAATLQTYVAGKGYGVLSTINPGEGYWVNAKAQPAIAPQSGDSFIVTSVNLAKGWNLVATGNDISPSAFNTNLKSSLPGTGVTTLWAWDSPSAKWYFYAPSLEAQGGTALIDYINSKSYLDFTQRNKTLGNGTGFWVNR